MIAKLLLSALFLAAQCLSIPLEERANPIHPKLDPFYNTPANVGTYKPGAIIRSRKTPGPIGGIEKYTTSNIKASYQLLYRTTDTVGRASAAVCLIIIPHNADYSKVLAYQTAYDSADENCSPSYTLQKKSNSTSYDPLFMAAALNEGWVITTSDYEGTNAAYVAGVGSGMATLDSVRATLASTHITGVSSQAKYALWGYSGGALASEWAIELQPMYAPDLHFIGAALGGLTPNATAVLLKINGGEFAGLAFSGINGLMAAYSNLTTFINKHLIPSKAAEFKSPRTECTNSSSPNLAFQNITTYFDQGIDTLYHPVPQSILKWGTQMGVRDIPTVPIYAYKAIGDEISAVQDTDTLLSYYCGKGATVEYLRNTVGEHVTEAILGSGGAFAWLKDRFAGTPAPKGCSTMNVTVTGLDLSTIVAFGDEIVGVLDLLLTQPLGPGSVIGI